jgi:hypothetical protein
MESDKAGRDKDPANDRSIASEDSSLIGDNDTATIDPGAPATRLQEAAKQLRIAREELCGEAHAAATRALIDVQRARLQHEDQELGAATYSFGPEGPPSDAAAGVNEEEYYCCICETEFDTVDELIEHGHDPSEETESAGYGVTD